MHGLAWNKPQARSYICISIIIEREKADLHMCGLVYNRNKPTYIWISIQSLDFGRIYMSGHGAMIESVSLHIDQLGAVIEVGLPTYKTYQQGTTTGINIKHIE